MNYYEIWVNLRESQKDLEFSKAVHGYMEHLRGRGVIEHWRLTRRKFGFGPPGLGEFHISIGCKDLAQLDAAFGVVATRAGGNFQPRNWRSIRTRTSARCPRPRGGSASPRSRSSS